VARRLVNSGHRVIAYDQRGHGKSTTGTDPFTVTRIGSDLRELLVALDAHDAVLAGHSMGGMTIMSLIGEDPVAIKEHACAVVLVATAAAGLGRNARLDESVGRLITSRGVTRLMSGPLGPHLARSVIGAHPCYSHLEAVCAMWTATPAGVARDAWTSMSEMDLRAGLAGCPVPATVMVGTRDQLTRRGLAQEIAGAIPGAELVTIHGAGHMLPLEEPDQVADVISRSSVAP
jgi:pimeloyl-ACP methyl ester carboxylesterase